jgi:hypothetical protein
LLEHFGTRFAQRAAHEGRKLAEGRGCDAGTDCAVEMQDVGCPEPAAVVDINGRMLNRWALCLMASIVASNSAVAMMAVIRPLPSSRLSNLFCLAASSAIELVCVM